MIKHDKLEILVRDFADISRKAFELKAKKEAVIGKDVDRSFAYSMALRELTFFDDIGIVWYGGKEGFMPEKPIGKPEDYLKIRDDYEELKKFVGSTLDRGKLHAGGGTHGDSSRETNCADYVVWLYKNNQNKNFKKRVKRAVTELLEEAIKREYASLDINSALQIEQQIFERNYHNYYECDIGRWLSSMLGGDNLSTALWRLGLDNTLSDEDKKIKAKFEEEFKKTERPITLEEVCNRYAGNKEKLREDFEAGKFADVINSHCNEMTEEFKINLRDRHIKNRAMEEAARIYSPQFNRLLGLLDVVAEIGEKNDKFVQPYKLLNQKAKAKFMADAPLVVSHYSGSDIYRNVLVALSSVQQGRELEQFWLDSIGSDPRSDRVIASVHGLLSMYKSKARKRKLIPAILDKIYQREYDVDQAYKDYLMIGFYKDRNLLEDITDHIARLCFSNNFYYNLDKTSKALDFLESRTIVNGKYDFRFTRYDTSGTRKLNATFNLAEDSISGNTEVQSSVRAYLNENGYELLNGVSVTSLEGRKISGSDSKIIKASEQSFDGLYEGIVGLNHTYFPFVYDKTTGSVLLVEPLDSRTVMFGIESGWEKRRFGFSNIKNVVDYSQFQSLSVLGERVNQLVGQRKKQGYLGDSLYSLKNKLTEQLAPYLSSVIDAKLINLKDGLVM